MNKAPEKKEAMERVHMVVEGRVQGVWFRGSTEDEARALGLTGWVRNLGDGGVEVVAEGDPVKLEALVNWCRKGPTGARVTKLVSNAEPYTGEFREFKITYSAG
jgi:acylphosphatase